MRHPLPRPQFIAVVGFLLLLFLWLGWTGGAGNSFDVMVVRHLADLRHQWPERSSAIIWLTKLGGAWSTLGLTLIASIWLWLQGERRRAAVLAATVAAGRLLADSIKLAYARPRPSFDLHPIVTNSSSYPSGHAANSMAAFVALALFAAPPRWRRPALFVAILASVAVSLTRPFLGVHWPSDMIGGWALAWIVLLTAQQISGDGTASSDYSPASTDDR